MFAALAAACVVSGCSGRGGGGGPNSAPQPAAGAGEDAAVARARADSIRRPYTVADVAFMTNMIGHHAQALQMSGLARANGAGRSVQILADRIINGQQDDIVLMQRWLRDRRQPVPQVGPTGDVAHPSGHAAHGAHTRMPGMLTDAQMEQLREARGRDFDVLFLTYMIGHHRGAVHMVKELLGNRGAAADETVFRLASDVNVDQTTEIARMEQMLVELQP
jgi:uncharacterized protein (DUF305 family)